MISKLDDLLNKITMYRLVLYGLSFLALVAFILSASGTLDFSPIALGASLAVIMTVGFISNQGLLRVWRVPGNFESGIITCLILFFLLTPTMEISELFVSALVTVVAIASKFLVVYRGKHIFNPAAFGLVAVGLMGFGHASWWVGSSSLWYFTLVLGLLVARKSRRVSLVVTFWVVSLMTGVIVALSHGIPVEDNIHLLIVSSPLIFLGSIMLTEPSTMPPLHGQRLLFAAGTAVLFASHVGGGVFYVYPETALLIMNIYAFMVSDKRRYILKYIARRKLGVDSYDYEFESGVPLLFKPGQYMEVTLPLQKMDDRGNRRTFTIASAPSEKQVHIGIRIPKEASRLKQQLGILKPGQVVFAGQIAGSFVLPRDASRKVLFIAGGVGVTPFRSMVRDIIAGGKRRDIVLVYAARSENDFMYKSVFDEAQKHGVRTVYVSGEEPMTTEQLSTLVPDVAQRAVYVSGPPAMTRHFRQLAARLGVSRRNIKTDYFAGY